MQQHNNNNKEIVYLLKKPSGTTSSEKDPYVETFRKDERYDDVRFVEVLSFSWCNQTELRTRFETPPQQV